MLEGRMAKDDNEFYEELGERVAEFRKDNDITQVQMAQMLGVSQQQIASYEAGRVKIPIASLPQLSQILAVSIDEILGVEKRAHRGPTAKLQQLMEMIGELPKAKQKFIIEMLDAILSKESRTP
jgi:transcriptional regulator with XRE-family HTH domain